MSYVVKSSGKKLDIHETEWDMVIPLKVSKREANTIARKLNLGSGFGQGPIPSFFCSEFKSINA